MSKAHKKRLEELKEKETLTDAEAQEMELIEDYLESEKKTSKKSKKKKK